jgi:hypothetical protein
MTTNITKEHWATCEALTSGDYRNFRAVLPLRERRTGRRDCRRQCGRRQLRHYAALCQRHARRFWWPITAGVCPQKPALHRPEGGATLNRGLQTSTRPGVEAAYACPRGENQAEASELA